MIYDIVNTIFYVILAQLFISSFMKRRAYSIVQTALFSLLWAALGIAVSVVFPSIMVLRILLAVALNILFTLLLFLNENTLKSVVIATLYYVIAFVCDMFVVSIQKWLDQDMRIDMIMQDSISVYMGTVSQVMQFFLILVVRRLFRNSKLTDSGSRMWLIHLVFPVFSLSIIVLFAYSLDGPMNTFQKWVFLYLAVSLLLINMFVYWFIRQDLLRSLRLQSNEIEIAHAKEITDLYNQIATERDILGKREHEYKNTMTVLYSLASNNNFEDVKSILEDQNIEIARENHIIETGNRLISTIINTKYADARQKKIKMRFNVGNLSKVAIDERDCIVIFSNILNNAIEAAQRCAVSDRYINVKATVNDSQFIFAVRNSCSDQNNDLKSRKNDIVSHGYGLKNIKEAVERNNGICHFENSGIEFVSVVIFPV